ncbi:MAG: DUF554 domain-containing protein [Faecalibacterium sp.]|nr:DUF554 domain-containing protein [Faecalibacterium sp.]
MPVGVLTLCSCVLLGSILGCLFGRYVPQTTRDYLNTLLGFSGMALGINSIVKATAMSPVILAVVVGSALGELCGLERRVTALASKALKALPLRPGPDFDMERYITAVVLFCFSGLGFYGTLLEAMSGDPSILLSKSVLDFCTALVFAITLGAATALITAPMLCILLLTFALGSWVAPLTTPAMLQDFMACGGVLTLAAGLRISGIKRTPVTNMIPSLILALPLSWLWSLLPL